MFDGLTIATIAMYISVGFMNISSFILEIFQFLMWKDYLIILFYCGDQFEVSCVKLHDCDMISGVIFWQLSLVTCLTYKTSTCKERGLLGVTCLLAEGRHFQHLPYMVNNNLILTALNQNACTPTHGKLKWQHALCCLPSPEMVWMK